MLCILKLTSFWIILLSGYLYCVFGATPPPNTIKNVNVGIMMSKNNSQVAADVGYQNSASAVYMAIERANQEQLLNGFKLNISFMFDNCNEWETAGLAAQAMINDMDVLIGPTCNNGAVASSTLGAYYSVPSLTWGLVTASVLADNSRFPATITIAPMSQTIAYGLIKFMSQFDFTEFVFLYGDTEYCNNMQADINSQGALLDDVNLSRSVQLTTYTMDRIKFMLSKNIQPFGRIIAMCFVDNLTYVKRLIMLAAMDLGMLNNEYVFVFIDNIASFSMNSTPGADPVNIWVDTSTTPDGRDGDALAGFQRVFSLLSTAVDTPTTLQFRKDVVARMKQPPLSCTKECADPIYQQASTYSPQLYDVVYLYALAINRTARINPNYINDSNYIIQNCAGRFDGMSGTVVINSVGVRCPILSIVSLDANNKNQVVGTLSINGTNSNFSQSIPYPTMWRMWGGAAPPAVPKCGFLGDTCPASFVTTYLWIVIAAAVLICIVALAGLIAAVMYRRQRAEEEERKDRLWQISSVALTKATPKTALDSERSERSLQSGPSTTSTKVTVLSNKTDSARFSYFFFEKEPVAAEKHNFRPHLTKADTYQLRHMRDIDDDNINRFIGLSMDGPICMSIWRFCTRGSIKNILLRSTVNLDGFFIYSMMTDISNGLSYIHTSFLQCHGRLTSSCCMINDRWQVKISSYGLGFIRSSEKKTEQELLYSAPELLREGDDSKGTKEGDIYATAIICSELITRKGVWNLENRKEEPDEILFMVKRGGRNPMRPELDVPVDIEVNPALLLLVKECWEEEPNQRPKIDFVRTNLRRMQNGRNLMDHVFNALEIHANTLEEEVEYRMKELVEEKKKSDILLYRMLPQQVADKLKLGQSVEPEFYDSVTIFFSDVVSFTTLASKCTPLQVVNLLNDLYSIFDSIIDEHDAYKVETIGDGYLCVSGLPKRNGTEHIREICSMSLALLKGLKGFRIPHLPRERVNIRIGIHTGSCVAGVVGLTMPRYCLFGDAVNTASRMESNGKPGQIHLSPEARALLVQMYPQYKTESRGEVIIKGKGVMETYWLLNDEVEDDEK